MTARQKAYREYLQSDHWANLRELALVRDERACVVCGRTDTLQVHHKRYRATPYDTLLEDLETLCRKCHRQEHGYGPSEFELIAKKIEREFNYIRRPPKELWIEFKSLMIHHEFDYDIFSQLMFQFVYHVRGEECEGGTKDWWMIPEKHDKWRRLAFKVRNRIRDRINGKAAANVR